MMLSLDRQSWISCKISSIDCISAAQVWWNTDDYWNLNIVVLVEVELKKKLMPVWEDWINIFILRECTLSSYTIKETSSKYLAIFGKNFVCTVN